LVIPSLIIAALGTLTWRQSQVWRTTESLWTHTHRGDPTGSFAMNGYGYVLLNRGDYDEAILLFRAVLAVSPDNDKTRVNLWDALERNGDEAALIVALREGAENSTVAYEAHYRMGNILLGQRKFAEAAAEFRAALQARPGLATAHTNLGVALQNLGELQQATQEYQLAIAADPNLYQPRLHLAVILRSQGQTALAIEQFREVLRLKPDHPAAAANLKELTGEPR
jgi:tetratricopeptide (TPR) repeat protein